MRADAPVLGIDIDGTLGRYHEHFFKFAAAWFGVEEWKGWPNNTGPYRFHWSSYSGATPLYQFMGVSKTRYRQCKLAYRQGGLKRSMPVYFGAEGMCRSLRRHGVGVVLCTTRPYLHLSNVEPDTMEWLRRNRIGHDDLIMGEHKYRTLKRNYGDRVVAVLDDEISMVNQAAAIGIPSLLIRRDHNSMDHYAAPLRAGQPEVSSLPAATDELMIRVQQWRGNHEK